MKKKTMYLVRKNHINEEPVPATVFCNDEDGSIDHLHDPEEDCYLEPDKFFEFFDIKEEAESFQYTFKKFLISKMSEVKDYLIMMDGFDENDESSEFYHKRSDYINYDQAELVVYWQDQYFHEKKLRSKFQQLAEKGVISLCEHSILYSEVECAYREDKNIILRLKSLNGEVSVSDKIDKEFVSEIFGL